MSPNIRMFGRARPRHEGHEGIGGRARQVVSSISTNTPAADRIGSPQPRRHWRKWIEPWHSTIRSSGKPAFWNCPSTFDVKTKAPSGLSAAHSRSVAKPSCGTVRR